MYLNKISPYTFYAKPPHNCVPLDEYLRQGKTILELTPDDIKAIEKIESEIAKMTLDLSKLESILAKTYTNKRYYYLDEIGKLEYEIGQKRNEIKEIKINRRKIQDMIAERTKKKS